MLFGDDSGLILDLVSYLIIDEENENQYYPDFAFTHPLFSQRMTIYSDSKVSRLLSSITHDQCIEFLNMWNKGRDHKDRIYISYDSTNKNCQDAGDFGILEYGKAKDEKGTPIFNFSVAMDNSNQVPLMYEMYPGSVNDVSQLTCMIDKVIDYGYKKAGFILDRGYFSKGNIQYMDSNGYSFVIMVKGCKPLVSELVMSKLNTFETNRDCEIRSYRTYGTTVPHRLYDDDDRERYFHIYFRPDKMAAEREKLEAKIDALSQTIKKKQGKKSAEFGDECQKYFHFHYAKDGTFLGADERKDVIEEELRLCGYYCIITSEKMDAAHALILYKGRDSSEKLFRADKTFIGAKSMRTPDIENISAKIFLEFIALIIRNRIYNLLKENTIRMDKRYNYMDVPAAIRKLEQIEMVRTNGKSYKLDHAITKPQKIILSSFGLDKDDIIRDAEKISQLLADGESLMNTDPEDDDNGTEEIA